MDKVIVITGAGSGLGRSIALRLARAGNDVVLLGRTLAKLEAVAAEIGERAMVIACDVARADSVRAAFAVISARFPRIDVLINNAATFPHVLIAEASDEDIVGTIGIDLVGPILCARSAIPMLNRGGQILNVSSGAVASHFGGLTFYAAAKAGLERFSLGLLEELQPQDISVTYVRAGQMVERLDKWDNDPVLKQLADQIASHGGIDPRLRPSSTFASVAEIFQMLIDLPLDLRLPSIVLRPRKYS